MALGGLEYAIEWMIACKLGFLSVLTPDFHPKKFQLFLRNSVKTGNKTREKSPIRGGRSRNKPEKQKDLSCITKNM
jgi:hypothetical protein